MSNFTKILLTIPSMIGLVYMWTFIYPKSIAWISNNIVAYEFQNPFVTSLILIQLGYLIHRLWSFKNIQKEKKTNWTLLLVIFNVVTSLIFIWKKYSEFEQHDKYSLSSEESSNKV
ncbi:hypothetical protein [Maribacter sp. 4G9]|uniref:hypothetical protein n=1 Tax=Maribacter sp. 4G9 TaxID=1889777 RepID=UPI000C3E6501|nr:hypothetical protein [Maribacter sp. 4G9]PIB27880.1 hypothetical protein BFP75_06335 [Maribacter sp. 4G9]